MTGGARYAVSTLQGTRLHQSPFLDAEDRLALGDAAGGFRWSRPHVDLVAEGVPTDEIHLLIEGWACRYKTTRNGARQITGLVVPGDICNLDTLMLDQVNFSVRTVTPATTVALSRARARALAAERPAIARALTWFAIVENAVLGEWALSLGRQTARERLARLFCELAVRLGQVDGNAATIPLPLTQENLADALGLTGVHVNRTMRQLREEGLIVVEARKIGVPDMAKLCRVGEFDRTYLQAAAPA